VRAALYARVSTERQADRGTIGSQLQLLREHIAAAGEELVGEYVDDGHSGARLDRPGLDALRDAAEAGLVERVWCLSPDRLARAYAYQVLVLDELNRFGVTVTFTDSPGLAADDPQATPAHPGAGRNRRIRESQDRRTIPARQTVPGPRGRDRRARCQPKTVCVPWCSWTARPTGPGNDPHSTASSTTESRVSHLTQQSHA
jgi:hypothetical protein